MHKATEGKSTSKPWGIGPTSSKRFKDIVYLVVCACVSVCVHVCVCLCTRGDQKKASSALLYHSLSILWR